MKAGGVAAGLLLAAAAGLYIVVAWQVRPGFYDGFAPPVDTYHWVSPPIGVTTDGVKPVPGKGTLLVSSDHSRVAEGAVATADKPPQASLTIPPAAFNPPAVDKVEVDLTPTAAPGRPETAVIVGNLYCVTSTASLANGQALKLTLRYSSQLPGADAIFRYDDETHSWSRLTATHDGQAATVTASITSLGCYAPASVKAATVSSNPVVVNNLTLVYVAIGAVLLVLVAGFPLYLRLRRDRRLRERT